MRVSVYITLLEVFNTILRNISHYTQISRNWCTIVALAERINVILKMVYLLTRRNDANEAKKMFVESGEYLQ